MFPIKRPVNVYVELKACSATYTNTVFMQIAAQTVLSYYSYLRAAPLLIIAFICVNSLVGAFVGTIVMIISIFSPFYNMCGCETPTSCCKG